MIHALFSKSKHIAWLFLLTLYGDLVYPNIRSFLFGHHYRLDMHVKQPETRIFSNIAGASVAQAYWPNQPKTQAVGKNRLAGGGPSQPESQPFSKVNGNNLVDLFTGDFSYSIPLLDVGGYPVSVNYSSGITMDQEASWVGLGWNLNPGTVSRAMRGLPDDFNGTESIEKTLSIRENKTVGAKVAGDIEVFGLPIRLGISLGLFHNTFNGWGVEQGINASLSSAVAGGGNLTAGVGVALDNNSQTGLNSSLSVTLAMQNSIGSDRLGISTGYHSRAGVTGLQMFGEMAAMKMLAPRSATLSFATPSYTPTISMPFTNSSYTFSGKLGFTAWGIRPAVAVSGYVVKQEISDADKIQKIPAVGYLNMESSVGRENVLMDFNREKELQFNLATTPHLAIPQYTHDIFTISGDGVGGSFRAYRGESGHLKDHSLITRSTESDGAIDVAFGTLFHVGVDVLKSKTTITNKDWISNNLLAKNVNFRPSRGLYEGSFLKNPSDISTVSKEYWAQAIGDTLVSPKLTGTSADVNLASQYAVFTGGRKVGDRVINSPIDKKSRDKRTQVISYLTAAEASLAGLTKTIPSYPENVIAVNGCESGQVTQYPRIDSNKKPHHISEIKVLNPDGKAFVYGIPVYNIKQEESNFSVGKETDPENIAAGITSFQAADDSVTNQKGKDQYYSKEIIPSYAQHFLLTGILSPDYVDNTGDGITEDDRGDAIRFNYSMVNGGSNPYFEWRTPEPLNTASYSEGMKSYDRDDRAYYIYGARESWYLHSIESKNLVAVFSISANRADAVSVAGKRGGLDSTRKSRRLDRIDLYSKSELAKQGAAARPIKTVHFSYSNSLCKGIYEGSPELGKLTLDSIWFSYNGNEKGQRNPYVFKYHAKSDGSIDSTYNHGYKRQRYDRWGSFKDPSGNPGALSNADFPYTLQDSAKAAVNAAMWTMDQVQLPSGGRMKITYESDDYAYVQNKRASVMFRIAGFGYAPSGSFDSTLYATEAGNSSNLYVYVETDRTIPTADIRRRLLENSDTVYLKVAVTMPTDKWGSGYELVPCYGVVESYGVDPTKATRIWLKLKPVDGKSPIVRAALQYMKNNLPSKAYPGSEVGDDLDLQAAIYMLATAQNEILNVLQGFETNAMRKHWCRYAIPSKSFVRLAHPDYRKIGGGHRVKRIEVFDSWNHMTGNREAVYGQEYQYRTSIREGKQVRIISSGVATYEPNIGGDENPFRMPLEYAEKLAPLAPVNYLYSEAPLGESYFPAASVGYSKVRVRTINRKAASANGWQEQEFYTTKDFPTRVEHTMLDADAKRNFAPATTSFLSIKKVNLTNVVQGFKIEVNDMNGKVKSQSSYAETDSLFPFKYIRYFYKTKYENGVRILDNSVWTADAAGGLVDTTGFIGRDLELINDFREQTTQLSAKNTSGNLDVIPILALTIPVTTGYRMPQSSLSRFRSAVTVKYIQRYGILDSIEAMDRGSIVRTKNLVFDGETGDVVVSRSQNSFNDPVYQVRYPAHWGYSGMAGAYRNINARFNDLSVLNGVPNTTTEPEADWYKLLEGGDELLANGMTHLNAVGGGETGCPEFVLADSTRTNTVLYVLDGRKLKNPVNQLLLVDAQGKAYTGLHVNILVTRSGHRNMLGNDLATFATMEAPLKVVAGKMRLRVGPDSRAVNASAATYADVWAAGAGYALPDSCRSNIADTSMNPYHWGVWGNWRPDRSYVYYAARQESSALYTQTNIRQEGTLKDFSGYWSFTDTLMAQTPDTSKWMWNTQFSQFSQKGAEAESFDPLGRYNAAIYGFNQSLPVAAGKNTRYRSLLQESFEDYFYKVDTCSNCPPRREANLVGDSALYLLDSSNSHTGQYSLKIAAGTTRKLAFSTSTLSEDSLRPEIDIDLSAIPVYTTGVVGMGTTLDVAIEGYSTDCSTPLSGSALSPGINVDGTPGTSPYGSYCPNNTTYTWSGYLQPKYTGAYTFYFQSTGNVSATINGASYSGSPLTEETGFVVNLVAGHMYPVSAQYDHLTASTQQFFISWSSSKQPKQVIPSSYFYRHLADSAGSIRPVIDHYCYNVGSLSPQHVIRKGFSPLKTEKIVLTGWVKMDGADCEIAPVVSDALSVSFDTEITADQVFEKTGTRIEGWQRFEKVITVPATAGKMFISCKAPAGKSIYFDDLRVQPYNGLVKGYTYDPLTLRLMAELDENNYATFFEYDDDGTLIRTKKETERGIMTIRETRNGLLKQ